VIGDRWVRLDADFANEHLAIMTTCSEHQTWQSWFFC